ncbi:MAG TPA: metalloregulator ArsR/SmtB family transcription factor [Tepidiformaceae bacterium]|nr:metalloregulator ArsR/SmtB family transcription factor [Tepidiformaceae bacterium]
MTIITGEQILKSVLDYSPVAAVFRALADPTRMALVERLSRGAAAVSTLAEPFDVSLTAIGQHIAVLEEAGLVQTEKIGRVRTCSLRPDAFEQWINAHRLLAERRLDRLEALLDETDRPGVSGPSRKDQHQ